MIGSDTSLSQPDQEYLDECITTLEDEVFVDRLDNDHFEALDQNEETRADWETYIERIASHDFAGIPVSSEYNGANGTVRETVLTEQAIGYCGTIVHACQTSLTQHVGHTMDAHGNTHIKETYLAPMLNGDLIVSQAYTEPTSGTDLTHLETTANRDRDQWIVNGEKRFIDFARYGDFFFVPCRTSGSPGDRNGLSLLVVDSDSLGITLVEDQSDWHGFRGTGAAWIAFDEVHVPRENLVGEEGNAWEYITAELNLEHLTVARYCLGASQRALEITANYTNHRTVNEQSLSEYQAVNHKLAELVTKLDAAYLLNTRAATLLDEEGFTAGRMESAMAKWYGNDLAHEIADACIQLMGGIGTTNSYPIERIQRDVRAGRFLGGASEVMKSIVQHDAYECLVDDQFNDSYVGNEARVDSWHDPT